MRRTNGFRVGLGLTALIAALTAGALLRDLRRPEAPGTFPLEVAGTAAAADRAEAAKQLDAVRQTALVTAAGRAGKSVVSIGTERTAYLRRDPFFDGDPFSFFFDPRPRYQRFHQRTPYLGSGIVVDDKGHVVTNHHVIEGAEKVFITLADGKEREAEFVGADAIADLAILKIDPSGVTPAVLGDSDDVRLGEWALAIGNPYGATLGDPTPTITAGVISATGRFFRSSGEALRLYEGMIQTDAAINSGNSGGALVNALGEVIGVNTFIFSESGGSVGIGFAIPVNRMKRMLEEIRQHGRLREVDLDFTVIDITPYIQQALGLRTRQGVVVYQVETRGPAAEAGIEPGDVVLKIAGHAISNQREFLVHVLGAPVGREVVLEVLRGEKSFETRYKVRAGNGT